MTTPSYATADQFRAYIRDPSGLDEDMIDLFLDASSREVEKFTGRHFYQTTSTQYFTPQRGRLWILELGDMDLATTTGLTVHVEFGIDGTYPETRVLNTDFICEPINQSVAGIEGWPFTSLRAINGKIWPFRYADYQRDTVKVVGTWGWPAIPPDVVLATLILTAESFKMMEAPFGYVGFGNFGTARVKDNPAAKAKLTAYKKQTALLMA